MFLQRWWDWCGCVLVTGDAVQQWGTMTWITTVASLWELELTSFPTIKMQSSSRIPLLKCLSPKASYGCALVRFRVRTCVGRPRAFACAIIQSASACVTSEDRTPPEDGDSRGTLSACLHLCVGVCFRVTLGFVQVCLRSWLYQGAAFKDALLSWAGVLYYFGTSSF